MASAPSESSQSGRSCPRRSAIAIAQRRLEVDARRSGEQRAVVGIVAAPRDLAGLALEVEREVDRGLDRRPELAEVRGVAGGEVVVPRAGRDVAGDVGVEGGVLDLVAEVVRVPAAVGALHACAATRTRARASSCGRRRRAPSPPRPCSTGRCGRPASTGCCRRAAGSTRWRRPSPRARAAVMMPATSGRLGRDDQPTFSRVDDEALAEHRVERAVERGRATRAAARSATRGSRGTCAPATRPALSTPTAHFSHQYGECSACAWCEPRSDEARPLELLLELVLAVDADVAAGRVVVVGGRAPSTPARASGSAR